MATVILRHLSFANVTSLAALVFAMGGTGYAVSKLPKNSVGTKQIRTNGVGSSEIKKNAVTAKKVKDGSLLATDFAAGQIPAGAKGATGAQGIQGIQGIPGPAGVVGAVTVKRTDFTVAAGFASTGTTITCPAGTRAIGGGAYFGNAGSDMALITSAPYSSGVAATDGGTFDAWRVAFSNPDLLGTASVLGYAICAQT
jgi:hypothetical protein